MANHYLVEYGDNTVSTLDVEYNEAPAEEVKSSPALMPVGKVIFLTLLIAAGAATMANPTVAPILIVVCFAVLGKVLR